MKTFATSIALCSTLTLSLLCISGCNRAPKKTEVRRPPINDNPGSAEQYQGALRVPPDSGDHQKRVSLAKRYEAAISHLHQMEVYSTATRTRFKVQRRLNVPWNKPFQLSDASTFETLIAPLSKLPTSASAAAPFAAVVGTAVSQPQVASALGTWSPIGPLNAGGRARALVINPSTHNSQVMLLATAGGGIWRTADAGASWIPVFDDKPVLAVSTLAMAPSDYRTIYAGTGEGFQNIDALKGNGIYRSQDNGITWTVLSATKDNPDFSYVQKIVVSPSNSNRVYAATSTGAFECCSSDGKWMTMGTGAGPLNASAINGCTDIAIQNRPASATPSTNYVFVACGNLNNGTLYRTVDADQPSPLEVLFHTTGRTSIAVSVSNPATVYAMSANSQVEQDGSGPGLQMVFRSDRDGASGTWADATNNKTGLNRMLLTNVDYAYNSACKVWPTRDDHNNVVYVDTYLDQGWYDNVLAVDPIKATTVWAGGVDTFRSDDSGANWGITSYWRALPSNSGSAAHGDVHAIVFHPDYGKANKSIFIATDGGVFRTDNADANAGQDPCGKAPQNAIKWTAINNGLSTIQFYSGALFPGNDQYVGGTQDNGSLFGWSDTTNAVNSASSQNVAQWKWLQFLGGDGGSTLVDSYNPKNVYASLPPNGAVQIYKSSTGPNGTFYSASDGLYGDFLFVTPLAMDPKSTAILWTGGDQVFRSSNAATKWGEASNQFTGDNYGNENSGIISTVAVSPFDSNLVLAGTNYDSVNQIGGWIHRTDQGLTANSQTSWQRSRPRRGWVSSIAFDPSDRNVVYATYSSFNSDKDRGHVFKSTSGGSAPWFPVDGPCDRSAPSASNPEPCNVDNASLPDIPVHTIVVDPQNPKRLWVGTDLGIFTSLDGGQSWAQENSGFYVSVASLVLDSSKKALFAFTHGRGVWRVNVN
jgi:hypothetical protein